MRTCPRPSIYWATGRGSSSLELWINAELCACLSPVGFAGATEAPPLHLLLLLLFICTRDPLQPGLPLGVPGEGKGILWPVMCPGRMCVSVLWFVIYFGPRHTASVISQLWEGQEPEPWATQIRVGGGICLQGPREQVVYWMGIQALNRQEVPLSLCSQLGSVANVVTSNQGPCPSPLAS